MTAWPKALIFDVDGTLAETEDAHLRAFNLTFEAAGLDWRWSREDYRRLLTTTGGKERMARHAVERGENPAAYPIAALHAAKTKRFTALVEGGGLQPRPGIRELIASARRAGIRLAVATTTSPENVAALSLALFGEPMERLFEVVAAGDAVKAKKPAPDVYLLALEKLGLPAADCVAFEDSRNGVLAAKGAGLRVVLAQSLFTEGEPTENPDLLAKDFAEIADLDALRAGFPPRSPLERAMRSV